MHLVLSAIELSFVRKLGVIELLRGDVGFVKREVITMFPKVIYCDSNEVPL